MARTVGVKVHGHGRITINDDCLHMAHADDLYEMIISTWRIRFEVELAPFTSLTSLATPLPRPSSLVVTGARPCRIGK